MTELAFLSTLPARGATNTWLHVRGICSFLSTLPARGATVCRSMRGRSRPDFYPRSPRGERPIMYYTPPVAKNISIHAPREGSDSCSQGLSGQRQDFYPRSPRGERLFVVFGVVARHQFLSTLPARGATSPRILLINSNTISIHAPREGSDRGALLHQIDVLIISIHAPREGSDVRSRPAKERGFYFYPRSPRGERQGHIVSGIEPNGISIHAPREGSDSFPSSPTYRPGTFLSTLPARGATRACKGCLPSASISIHAPREGSDTIGGVDHARISISIHAPREGSDL